MRSGTFRACDGRPCTRVARASVERCLVIKIVVTHDARVDESPNPPARGRVKLDIQHTASFNIIYGINPNELPQMRNISSNNYAHCNVPFILE